MLALDSHATSYCSEVNGNPPDIPPVPDNWAATLIRHQILLFCLDGPRSILEIGHMLGHSFGNDITNGVYGHQTLEELRMEIEKTGVLETMDDGAKE